MWAVLTYPGTHTHASAEKERSGDSAWGSHSRHFPPDEYQFAPHGSATPCALHSKPSGHAWQPRSGVMNSSGPHADAAHSVEPARLEVLVGHGTHVPLSSEWVFMGHGAARSSAHP